MSSQKKILFITPSSGRNGSEVYIWNLFLNLSEQRFKTGLFSLSKGALFEDYNAPSNAFFSKYKDSYNWSLFKGIIRRTTGINLYEKEFLKAHRTVDADLWYLNTAVMPDVARIARENDIPYVVHLHEMLLVYGALDKNLFIDMLEGAQMLIACSEAVAAPLKRAGFADIIVEHESVDLRKIQVTGEKRSALRKELGIAENSFVWVMSGRREAVKGIDFIPEIAKKLYSNSFLLWIGGSADANLSRIIQRIVENENLENVMFIEEKGADYYDYLSLGDGLLLTSREDSFPLIMIEAAFLGKPVVGFDSGGIKEFVIPGKTGYVADKFNVEQLCAAMNAVAGGRIRIDKDLILQRSQEFSLENRIKIWEEKINFLWQQR